MPAWGPDLIKIKLFYSILFYSILFYIYIYIYKENSKVTNNYVHLLYMYVYIHINMLSASYIDK